MIMQKALLFIISILLSTQIMWGQLTLSQTSFTEDIEIGQDVEFTTYLTNASDSDLNLRWTSTPNVPNGWINFVCDTEQCYPPGVETADFPIAAGATVPIKVTFRASTQEQGNMGLRIFEIDDPNNKVDANFVMNGVMTSNTDDLALENIKIYPNPASNYIKLSNSYDIERLEIFNVIGRKVKSFHDLAEGTLHDISDLARGIYLVRMIDRNNDILITKRISKR